MTNEILGTDGFSFRGRSASFVDVDECGSYFVSIGGSRFLFGFRGKQGDGLCDDK